MRYRVCLQSSLALWIGSSCRLFCLVSAMEFLQDQPYLITLVEQIYFSLWWCSDTQNVSNFIHSWCVISQNDFFTLDPQGAFCLCDAHEKFWCRRDAPLRRCLDCHKHFRVICEAHEEEKLQRDFYERIRPLYLCDQSVVCIMVKVITKGPFPLGAWVQQNRLMGVSRNVSLDAFIHQV